jgi:hypothetical protein
VGSDLEQLTIKFLNSIRKSVSAKYRFSCVTIGVFPDLLALRFDGNLYRQSNKTTMETQFTPAFFTETEPAAQILPLTQDDFAQLEKQKKYVNRVIIAVAVFVMAFFGYEIIAEDMSFYFALFVTPFALAGVWLGLHIMIGGINDNILKGIKHVGKARIISKNTIKNSYWVELDWHFSKELRTVYVTSDIYYSIKKNDWVQIEVLPKTKSALSLKKHLQQGLNDQALLSI